MVMLDNAKEVAVSESDRQIHEEFVRVNRLLDLLPIEQKEIVRLMVDNHYFEQDVDNEVWGERRITFNEGNIDFFFEDDELMSVIIGK